MGSQTAGVAAVNQALHREVPRHQLNPAEFLITAPPPPPGAPPPFRRAARALARRRARARALVEIWDVTPPLPRAGESGSSAARPTAPESSTLARRAGRAARVAARALDHPRSGRRGGHVDGGGGGGAVSERRAAMRLLGRHRHHRSSTAFGGAPDAVSRAATCVHRECVSLDRRPPLEVRPRSSVVLRGELHRDFPRDFDPPPSRLPPDAPPASTDFGQHPPSSSPPTQARRITVPWTGGMQPVQPRKSGTRWCGWPGGWRKAGPRARTHPRGSGQSPQYASSIATLLPRDVRPCVVKAQRKRPRRRVLGQRRPRDRLQVGAARRSGGRGRRSGSR